MLIEAERNVAVLRIDRAVSIGREGYGVVGMIVEVGEDVLGEEYWREKSVIGMSETGDVLLIDPII